MVMKETDAFEIKITRDENTKIFVKTSEMWEKALAGHAKPVDANERIKKTFGVKRFYPVPNFVTSNTSTVIRTPDSKTVFYLKDDFEDEWHFLTRTGSNQYQINLAFLRCEGIKDGVTAFESSLFSKAELEMFAEAIMRAYRKAYIKYCRPFEISVSMKTREPVYENGFAEEDLEGDSDEARV